MYYAALGILAILLHLIVNHEVLYKDRRKVTGAAKDYRAFLIALATFYVADALWGVFDGLGLIAPLYADTVVHAVTLAVTVIFWFNYVLSYLEVKKKLGRLMTFIVTGFWIAEVIILLVNRSTPILFSYDASGHYQTGIARIATKSFEILLYVACGILTVAAALRTGNRTMRKRYGTISLFSLVMVITVFTQYLMPLLPLYTLGFMIGTSLVHTFIQEDEKDEFRRMLEENEEQLEENMRILANTGNGLWKITLMANGRHTMDMNDKLKEIFGIQDLDLSPEQMYRYYHDRLIADVSDLEDDDYKSMAQGTVRMRTLDWDHPTKGIIHINAGGVKHVNDKGENIISGYCGDVTDEVERERRRQRILEENIAANKAKTRFLQNMSHEIRTPLNAIVGYSQILSLPGMEISEAEKEEYFGLIMHNSEMLTMLIDDILDISDNEHGNYRINIGECDCNDLCRKSISSVQHRVSDGVRLYFTTDFPDGHTIHSDGRRIQQVLINYLTNACKHTSKGEIHLHCSASENPGKVTFSVADTGTGVPEDKMDVIFERFMKLDEFAPGSGLGLNICLMIADKLGGKVFLDKNYSPGARFVFIVEDK